VDDNAAILEALQSLLESVCDIVGLVSDARTVLEAVTRLKPDVVLLDISMPHVNGLEVCRQIRDAIPETRVIILSAFGDTATKDAAYGAGASAFVMKHSVNEVLEAVQRA
jgi:DNA-binding NarL/FixJ family response regulator